MILGGKKYYEVSISDNGPGIPDELKAKLFRRFQRWTTRAQGKGLGLYITKMLVERFGGKACVEDRIPGDHTKGSKFIILLPAA
jgi:signal transduction histidine kinase